MASGQRLAVAPSAISRQSDLCALRCSLDLHRSQRPRVLRRRQACSPVASGLKDLVDRIWHKPHREAHLLSAVSSGQSSHVFTAAAALIGQRLLGLCLRLVSIVTEQLKKDGAWIQQATFRLRQWPAHSGNWPWKRKHHEQVEALQQLQHQELQAAEEVRQQKQRLIAAQLLQAQSMLQQHRPDKELMRVIKTLGDSNIPLDTKWLEFTQRLASHGHDAISDSMRQLFTAAGESSQAVQALLSPELQSKELWKSARTQSVIQQERAFKQMVFNQLLLTSN